MESRRKLREFEVKVEFRNKVTTKYPVYVHVKHGSYFSRSRIHTKTVEKILTFAAVIEVETGLSFHQDYRMGFTIPC